MENLFQMLSQHYVVLT